MGTRETETKWHHLGIVAGGGPLPLILAHAAALAGKRAIIACVKGFADQDWSEFSARYFHLEEIAEARRYFLDNSVDAITFAGLVRRSDMDTMNPVNLNSDAEKALRASALQGDDRLLRGVIDFFEAAGLVILGAGDVAPEYVLGQGLAGACDVPDEAREDCRHAANIARQIGALDIGQSAVVAGGLVLAVEAQEGTAQMLARCAALPETLRGSPENRHGVFAKWAKPGQDRRIDLPVVGVDTITAVARAGLAGLALEAGAVIMLEPEAVIAAADRLGVFIVGMEAGD